MSAKGHQRAHRHLELPQLVGAAEVRKIDDEAGREHLCSHLPEQLHRAFRQAVDEMVQPYAGMKIDKVAGMEARGFILGGAVAHQVSAGFVPIRKKGKLPHTTVRIAYSLEYGLDEMEMHEDAIVKGERVILVDDLVATGGTAEAAVKLLKQIGAEVLAACFIIDLPELGGSRKLEALGMGVHSLMAFEGH